MPQHRKVLMVPSYEGGPISTRPDREMAPSILNVFIENGESWHRNVIQYFHLKDLSRTNIKTELDFTLGESAHSFTTVKYWVAELKRGSTSCQDEHRSGRPNEVTSPEMVKKIHKAILDDRRLKAHELADIVGISKSAVHRILSESLDMRKLCAR
ncbi:mariner transposase [Trichonephila clavipes]|nr:mariner transposase [Trichonephila clavipes]